MDRVLIMKGKKVSLSLIMKEDVPIIWRWHNDREVQRFLANSVDFTYLDDEYEWYDRIRKVKDKVRVFTVVENGKRNPVRTIGLNKIDLKNGHAEIGSFIGKECWGKGFATEAVGLMTDYAFSHMNLRKIYATVNDGNAASSRVLEKNGFSLVGRMKSHNHLPGLGFVDNLIYERGTVPIYTAK